MKCLSFVAFLLFCTSSFGQISYAWKAGTAYSSSVQVDDYRQLESIHAGDGSTGAVLIGGMTVDGRLYGQAVAVQNGGHEQLNFDATSCYLLLADGSRVVAMNALDLEKWEKHEKRKQFWKDVGDAGVDQMNANTAGQLGADQESQTQMLAQGVVTRDASDAALLHSLDAMNGQSLITAGLQPGESASGTIYFQIPKDKQNVAIVGIGMHVGSADMYFEY